MHVREIDVHNDAEFERFWAAGKEGNAHGRPYAAFWSLQEAAVALRDKEPTSLQLPLAAIEGDEVLGTCVTVFPTYDNTHLAYLEPVVLSQFRNQGVGSALLAAGLALVAAENRGTAVIEVNRPVDDDHWPGYAFLAHRGFEPALMEIHRVLDLPVPASTLAELEQAALSAAASAGYRLVTWDDHVPDAYIEDYCALQSAFNSEAPMGELEIHPEVWDEARVRKVEDKFRRQGRREVCTVAVASDGEVVALTQMMTGVQQPETSWQSGTLVMPAHRGHRLGMAIKVANLKRFQDRFPRARTVHSWNAEQNGPMVAINEALGFRPVEQLGEMQIGV